MQESTLNKIRRVLNLGESTKDDRTPEEMVAHHEAELAHFDSIRSSAVAKQKWYGSKHPDPTIRAANNEEAYRRHRAILKGNVRAARLKAGMSVESFKEKTADNVSAEEHLAQYRLRSSLAMDHANAGRMAWAGIHQKAAERHAAAYHSMTLRRVVDPLYVGNSPHIGSMAETFDPIKSFKRGASGWDTTFPRFNDLNDVSKGINYGRPKDIRRNTRTQSDEFLHSIHKRHVPNPDSPAGLQQRVARNELERRRKSGKLDPKFHIKQDNIETKRVYGEAKEEDEAKPASVFPKAHHWNNAKRAYGVPLSVPLHAIGGYGVDKAGNRVSKKELVQRHAFAAANAASKWTPEEKRAWVQAKIAKAVAAKKAREATNEAISTSWENRGKFQVYAGTSTNCEPVGRAHLSHDEAWKYAKQVKASPASKHLRSSPLFIHDSGTGAIHGMSGRILGYTKI